MKATKNKKANEAWKYWYQKNPRKHIERVRARKARLRALVSSLKDKPCADCGIKYPPYVMQFDHRENKLFHLAEAPNKGIPAQKILDEAAKCDVVCSNCHALRTFR